jgi:hypothetical protein
MHKWIRSTQKRFSLTPSVAMAAFAPVQRLAPFRSPVVSWARARPRAEPWQRIPTQAGDQTLQKKSSNILWHFMTFYDAMRCRNHSKWGMVRHGEVWWGLRLARLAAGSRWRKLPPWQAAGFSSRRGKIAMAVAVMSRRLTCDLYTCNRHDI